MAENNVAAAKSLDFTQVKDRGAFNPKHMTEGDYLGRVIKVTEETSKAGNEMWVFHVACPSAGVTAVYPYRCTLDEKSLWKIRNVLVACGYTIPKKRIKVDPQKTVGKDIGITLVDNEYEGNLNSQINAVFPASDLPENAAATGRGDGDDEPEEDEEEVSAGGGDDEATVDEVDELDVDEM